MVGLKSVGCGRNVFFLRDKGNDYFWDVYFLVIDYDFVCVCYCYTIFCQIFIGESQKTISKYY